MRLAHVRHSIRFALSAAVALLVIAACGDDGPKPPGTVAVSFSTKQGDEAVFVWGVSVDGASPRNITSTDTGKFNVEASAGDHHLILSSLPKVCTSGSDDRLVTVPSHDTLRVSIAVKCTRLTGDIALNILTSGADFDADGYTVFVDGSTGPHAAAATVAVVLLAKLTPGPHEVVLSGLAANCSVLPTEPHTAVVVADQAVTLNIGVICKSTAGSIRVVTNTTSSATADPNGYFVTVGTGTSAAALNNSVTTVAAKVGTYDVTLSDVEPSCNAGALTRAVTVGTNETVTVTFDVICAAYPATVAGVTVADPLNDTLPNAANNAAASFDVVAATTRYAPGFATITLKLSRLIAANTVIGYIDLDLDENATTGGAPLMNFYGGTAAQGVEASIFFQAGSAVSAVLAFNGSSVQTALRVIVAGDSLQFFVPFARLKDDGNMTITTIIGTQDRPTDFAPNTGVIVSHLPPGAGGPNLPAPYATTPRAAATDALARDRLIWGKPPH